jgi:hypothetical protein
VMCNTAAAAVGRFALAAVMKGAQSIHANKSNKHKTLLCSA